jgi:peroxiredoxin
LRRWEELRPELDARSVALVAVCTDTPDEIRKGRGKHGAQVVLLSDRDLAVTDRYNLRNPRNVTPRGLRPMPIPTTFLVDARGFVRWIDQSDDYMLRSDPQRVLAALRESLPEAPPEARTTT